MTNPCYGCFEAIAMKHGRYCAKCRNALFGGAKIQPLSFDKREFYAFRNQSSGRMSLSGVQDKISLALTDGVLRPTAERGRYILKPIPSTQLDHAEDIVANEHLSMQLSKQIFNINTATCALIPFSDGEPAYIVKRFDYAPDGVKLDQEDFASILGYSGEKNGENYKYDGSYESIAKAIKKHVAAYRPALSDFYKRVLFNYAIGNGDAHLKNFSLYRPDPQREDFVLTPNYDLLYTKYHINETYGEMGMELFEDTETKSYGALGFYSQEDLVRFADVCQVPPKMVASIFTLFFESIPKVEALVMRSFLSDRAKEAYCLNYRERLTKRFAYSIAQEGYGFTSPIKTLAEHFLKQQEH